MPEKKASTTPEQTTEQQTSEPIEQGALQAEHAATTVPNTVSEDTLNSIATALRDIKEELRLLNVKTAEHTTRQVTTEPTEPEKPTEPDVTVTKPEAPMFRFVRRNGRKVKREAKATA